MKHLINKLFLTTLMLFLSTTVVSAQQKMNHSVKDSAKQMQHHMMMDSTNHMNHEKMDSTKIDHKNMHHDMTKNHETTMSSEKEIWNTHCPIREGEVDLNTPTVEYKGKTIGFCCPGCDSKFMENPEKYLKKFTEDGKLKSK